MWANQSRVIKRDEESRFMKITYINQLKKQLETNKSITQL